MNTQELKPLAVTVAQAQKVIGLSHSTIYELIADGRLKSTTVGRRRLILYASLEALVAGSAQDKAA